MDRGDTLEWLMFQVGPLYDEFGRVTDDSPSGFGSVISAALAAMGVSSSSFPVQAIDIPKFQAFLNYFALRPLLYSAAMQVDASVDAPLTSIKDRSTFKNIKDLFEMAKYEAQLYGLNTLDTTSGFLRWNTDWVEPVDEASEGV